MCKYCNGSQELKVYSDDGLRAEINNDYIPRLIMYTTINTSSGYIGIDGAIDINYCPICGEKLIVDSE